MEKKIFTNTIYNEDCLKVLRQMPDNSVDAIVTDPPYELDIKKKKLTGIAVGKKNFAEIEYMSNGYDMKIFDEFLRVVKNANITVFCSLKQLMTYYKYFEEHGLSCITMTWCKSNPFPACGNTYLSDTEYILHVYESKCTANFVTDHYLTPTVHIKKTDPMYHPTTKPISILKDLIEAVSDEGDVILDPFMGSGSTAAACITTGRYFIGCEMEEKYFDVCERKINNALAENPEYALTSYHIVGVDDETSALDAVSPDFNQIAAKNIDMAYIDITDDKEIPFELIDKICFKWLKKPNMYISVNKFQLQDTLLHFYGKDIKYDLLSNWKRDGTTFLLYIRKGALLNGDYNSKRKFFEDDRDLSLPNQDSVAYELMRRIITNSSKQGNTVFCYGGLGTCIEVCLRENRRFIAYDKDYSKILHYINTIHTTDAADDELSAA